MQIRKSDKVPENATDIIPPIEPAVMAHFMAIQSALTAEENAMVRRVASALSAGEVRVWFVALSKLTVEDAVLRIRDLTSPVESES